MSRRSRIPAACLFLGVTLIAVSASPLAGGRSSRHADRAPLSAATMIIEFNSSAEDLGIQFFLDSDGWAEIEIIDPSGKEVFSAEAEGSLFDQGGGTELFLESVEPPLDDVSFEEFFRRFPEGIYKFRGETSEGGRLSGRALFSHDIPAGPEITAPLPQGDECASDVAMPVILRWNPVTESIFGDPIDIQGYEVIVENDDVNFDVHIPASAGTQLTLSPEMLDPDTDYNFEILAIEEGGNQTITEGCFSTAP